MITDPVLAMTLTATIIVLTTLTIIGAFILQTIIDVIAGIKRAFHHEHEEPKLFIEDWEQDRRRW